MDAPSPGQAAFELGLTRKKSSSCRFWLEVGSTNVVSGGS